MKPVAVKELKLDGVDDPATNRPAPKSWLEQLYGEHWIKCCAYLRKKYGAGPPEPEDCVQQAFAQLAKLSEDAVAEIDQPKSFLYRIAENALIDEKRRDGYRRRHARETNAGVHEPSGCVSDPETVLDIKDQLSAVERALAALPERRREILLMHRMEGLSFTEIGVRLGMSRQGARKHVEMAIRAVEQAIAEREKSK